MLWNLKFVWALIIVLIFNIGLGTDGSIGGSTREHLSNMSMRRFSQFAHQFVKLTLTKHPPNRPSAEELLHHPFIKQTKKYHSSLKHILSQVMPITNETSTGKTIIYSYSSFLLH